MKSLLKQIKNRKHLIFLDLEGTQFSHEMIALGAVKVDINRSGKILLIHKGMKVFVKPQGKIGTFVTNLTGITKEQIDKDGITFADALIQLKKYCGLTFSRSVFVTFGNHDLRIVMQSLAHNPTANADIAKYICKNDIDLSATLAQYIKDANNNPFSLMNYLKVFGVTPEGVAHDPLWDAKNLVLLYQAAMSKNEIVFDEYLKLLGNMRHLPEPITQVVSKLVRGEDVTSASFKELVRESVK